MGIPRRGFLRCRKRNRLVTLRAGANVAGVDWCGDFFFGGFFLVDLGQTVAKDLGSAEILLSYDFEL